MLLDIEGAHWKWYNQHLWAGCPIHNEAIGILFQSICVTPLPNPWGVTAISELISYAAIIKSPSGNKTPTLSSYTEQNA